MNRQPNAGPANSAQDDEPLFFYMPDAAHGELCQWYPSIFTVSKAEISSLVGHNKNDSNSQPGPANNELDTEPSDESITFTCAEQFMMYCKAVRFNDADTQARVLATANPKEQKRLGRLTKGFDPASWDPVKSGVAEAGNMAKFGQNVKLRRKLLATGGRMLVEAASRDRVWGIGYTAKHAMSHRAHWGENLLGKALMAVRARLREDDAEVDRY
ncbi:hypothetical protein B0T24DRAFT_620757 [Lasiosphaeria ovina]|uniref:NADAR domain-containing protein n=1 Tax=Lasiosphaeria ovina TaxID=92902 RepID=A0AAE0KJA2_9PEZI|nr:hypothetical protein B0T24DRAFT_620757 [Lasiosphaeria ovina]